ncbi:hypothetical protein OH76DRAFT_1560391 [Lentinus brumalis]|uniref:Uncharacterized protein n=1 Tax=Lentinus brumalis TaxID=2498619 RepID=A0A371CST6_9APHY|nr:hypothetical protein OH76DRAFT_1560391 [Polyporus brumalis]
MSGDHSLGRGSLPVIQNEVNVALLPEESAHPLFDCGAIDIRGEVGLKPSEESKGNEASSGAARHVAGVGALVGDRRVPSNVVRTSGFVPVGAIVESRDDQGKQAVKPSMTSETAPGAGYDTDYHSAHINPPDEQYKDPSDDAAEGAESLAASGQQKEKESEAKVLTGKFEGNHEKVQQGQRMKSGKAKAGQ